MTESFSPEKPTSQSKQRKLNNLDQTNLDFKLKSSGTVSPSQNNSLASLSESAWTVGVEASENFMEDDLSCLGPVNSQKSGMIAPSGFSSFSPLVNKYLDTTSPNLSNKSIQSKNSQTSSILSSSLISETSNNFQNFSRSQNITPTLFENTPCLVVEDSDINSDEVDLNQTPLLGVKNDRNKYANRDANANQSNGMTSQNSCTPILTVTRSMDCLDSPSKESHSEVCK